MPGVFRPYTLVDILGTMNDQITNGNQVDTPNGLGDFAETEEVLPISDTMDTTVRANPTWDNGTWGTFTWT